MPDDECQEGAWVKMKRSGAEEHKAITLGNLLTAVNHGNIHPEQDFGPEIGKEL